jgi:hypothetical protein
MHANTGKTIWLQVPSGSDPNVQRTMAGWFSNCRDIHGSILPTPTLQKLLKYVTCRCEKVISKDESHPWIAKQPLRDFILRTCKKKCLRKDKRVCLSHMEIISHQMELMYDKVGTYLTLKNVSFS